VYLDFQIVDAALPVLDPGLDQLLAQVRLLGLELADLCFELSDAIFCHRYHHSCRDNTTFRSDGRHGKGPRSVSSRARRAGWDLGP